MMVKNKVIKGSIKKRELEEFCTFPGEACSKFNKYNSDWGYDVSFFNRYKLTTGLSQEDLYSLLLHTAVFWNNTNAVYLITSRIKDIKILTDIDASGLSTISKVICSSSQKIKDIVKTYISENPISEKITPIDQDYENILASLAQMHLEWSMSEAIFTDYLYPLYSEPSMENLEKELAYLSDGIN